ncbi:hypothetical protein PFLCHA0_c20510 [Pseudomonas protegens CHA0]|uniref:Uncharacterized protein n=1 Tax=Pseudomonas protegens (strain DSM 19095 / LMG 27888 / CFBP 6595 / CHA0) TaxID=1124983 RepID=A0A2C9EJK6_PSEPH|nr:hypothetical protein PFLCHA0_c20510 [Pseudomonas protegens CHA0]
MKIIGHGFCLRSEWGDSAQAAARASDQRARRLVGEWVTGARVARRVLAGGVRCGEICRLRASHAAPGDRSGARRTARLSGLWPRRPPVRRGAGLRRYL